MKILCCLPSIILPGNVITLTMINLKRFNQSEQRGLATDWILWLKLWEGMDQIKGKAKAWILKDRELEVSNKRSIMFMSLAETYQIWGWLHYHNNPFEKCYHFSWLIYVTMFKQSSMILGFYGKWNYHNNLPTCCRFDRPCYLMLLRVHVFGVGRGTLSLFDFIDWLGCKWGEAVVFCESLTFFLALYTLCIL